VTQTSVIPTAAESVESQQEATSSDTLSPSIAANAPDEGIATLDPESDSALDESSFLSFEEWKRQTLEREGLTDSVMGDRRYPAKEGERRRGAEGIQDALKALEDDIVIDTDFTAFLSEPYGDSAAKRPNKDVKDKIDGTVTEDVPVDSGPGQSTRYWSKDAGKTCKERFNFASLDAGAQVMKTNPEAKSASALLKEDRDVYMLNTCQAKNKFLIVELSESILVDTVAIANFEFFSSTFKQFRISVSNRYPVKLDRWVDLGTFETRNSREIQAFLIEDPRIWARYLRIEFLSHYGNEFYCPVSLLRVHGSTMIQDFLSMEEATRGEDDGDDELENTSEGGESSSVPEADKIELEDDNTIAEGLKEAEAAIEELIKTAEAITASKPTDALNLSQILEVRQWLESVSFEQMTTSWVKPDLRSVFDMSHPSNICLASESPTSGTMASPTSGDTTDLLMEGPQPHGYVIAVNHSGASAIPLLLDLKQPMDTHNITLSQSSKQALPQNTPSTVSNFVTSSASHTDTVIPTTTIGSTKVSNKSSATLASHSPQPTTQESFFKTVTKRLQLLEANSTLSLKYIEEQSRILRDAFTKVEKKQLSKTTSFLENLNATVFEELRKFSQQYDQIWQSTVIELETQREQSQREIAAVSTRLSLLADELVFQKRMSIVQSILLLLCLGLVIFSRGHAGAYLDMPIIQNLIARSRNTLDFAIDSAPSSPVAQKNGLLRQLTPWPGPEHRRQKSDDSVGSLRSRSRPESPPTPYSTYSGQEEEIRHDVSRQELLNGRRGVPSVVPPPGQDKSQFVGGSNSSHWQDDRITPEEDSSSKAYPDFKNSALWFSSNPLISEAERAHIQQYVESQSGVEGHSPIYVAHGSGIARPPIMNVDEQTSDDTVDSSTLPSPPPEREKPEFSIVRKPLPALPMDDQ
jgi:hypothetical protein